MLTLRTEQMDAFRDLAKRVFIERMYSHILSVFPEQCRNVTKRELTEIIERNIATAIAHELEMERSIRSYLMHAAAHGWLFNNQPPPTVERILTATQLSESAKIILLDKLLLSGDER